MTPQMQTAIDDFFRAIPDDYITDDDGLPVISHDKVDDLTDDLMLFIADILASLIDAGSEREVILENDDLRDMIRSQINDFATSWD